MSLNQTAVRPLTRCLRQLDIAGQPLAASRAFTTSQPGGADATTQAPQKQLDPNTVLTLQHERRLMKTGVAPIGSRRRRAVARAKDLVPFEQLPYQCFQEARKVLQADRAEKLQQITATREKIARLQEKPAEQVGGETKKQVRLSSLHRYLERLKILADINDPLIKKRFEDGLGDMNKPIYRHLADQKWRSFRRRVILQRLEQFGVVPDVLPHLDPTADVRLAFRSKNIQPGDYVDSRISELPAKLDVQVFDKGERLVSIAVIDSDVPDVETDSFKNRCHFLAVNVPLDPTKTSIPLGQLSDAQVVLPWLPPHALKGSPYHRLSVFVLQQDGTAVDLAKLKEQAARDKFSLRWFTNKFKTTAVGMTLFRNIWDESTAEVMARAGLEGADMEYKKVKIEALKPKQKPRGWEAKHAHPKYKPLRPERFLP